jgi:hypothetical protein
MQLWHQATLKRHAGNMLLACLSLSAVDAATIFVAPTGQFGGDGSVTAPWCTLTEAAGSVSLLAWPAVFPEPQAPVHGLRAG